MKKLISISILLSLFLLILLIFPLNANEVDVTGNWELTVESPRGDFIWQAKLVQNGEKLTVTMEDPRGREFSGEGTVKGDEIEWSVSWESRRGEITSIYKGTISGNEMTGEVQHGNFGSFAWKAKKIEEE